MSEELPTPPTLPTGTYGRDWVIAASEEIRKAQQSTTDAPAEATEESNTES